MSAFISRRLTIALVIAVAVPLGLTGCRGNSVPAGEAAAVSIAKFFRQHVDEFDTRGAAAAKDEVARTVNEGLGLQPISDARNAELAAVRSNPQEDEALKSVCNIAVDFAIPAHDTDSRDQTEVQSLMNAMAGESRVNGVKQWSERIVYAYEAVLGAPDAQTQAQLKLARDAEVFGFQLAYCNS